jgi:hypothetical protein
VILLSVIPAQAGTQTSINKRHDLLEADGACLRSDEPFLEVFWVPAYAGMTIWLVDRSAAFRPLTGVTAKLCSA